MVLILICQIAIFSLSKAHISGSTIRTGKYLRKVHRSIRETVEAEKSNNSGLGIGRTQEIMLILRKHGLRAYVDGMGVDVYN